MSSCWLWSFWPDSFHAVWWWVWVLLVEVLLVFHSCPARSFLWRQAEAFSLSLWLAVLHFLGEAHEFENCCHLGSSLPYCSERKHGTGKLPKTTVHLLHRQHKRWWAYGDYWSAQEKTRSWCPRYTPAFLSSFPVFLSSSKAMILLLIKSPKMYRSFR